MNKSKRGITLAIETAIGGGSLSLLEGRFELGAWTGNQEISKAEDVLESIAVLLSKNAIDKQEITTICVSKGGGSLTGEKIGLAIAKGLSRAFESRLIEVPLLRALFANVAEDFRGVIVTAIFTGKDRVLWNCQNKRDTFFFEITPKLEISTKADFEKRLNSIDCDISVLYLSNEQKLIIRKGNEQSVSSVNLARLIGSIEVASDNIKDHSPF